MDPPDTAPLSYAKRHDDHLNNSRSYDHLEIVGVRNDILIPLNTCQGGESVRITCVSAAVLRYLEREIAFQASRIGLFIGLKFKNG